jgi:hypothetical protein
MAALEEDVIFRLFNLRSAQQASVGRDSPDLAMHA